MRGSFPGAKLLHDVHIPKQLGRHLLRPAAQPINNLPPTTETLIGTVGTFQTPGELFRIGAVRTSPAQNRRTLLAARFTSNELQDVRG